MKKLLVLILSFLFIGTTSGFHVPESVSFTPDIQTDDIIYQYRIPQPSICFHPDDVSIRILMYHYIREPDRDPVGSTTAGNSLSSAQFEQHTRAFSNAQKQWSIRLFLLSELQAALETNCFPHDKIIILTSDDGRWDNYGQMFPLLKKYETKMNLWIITDVLLEGDTRIDPFMNKNELNEMETSPFVEIQSHTRTHADLNSLGYTSLKNELCQSKNILEEWYQKEISTIIYPFGKHNTTVMQVAKECGYTMWLSTIYWDTSPYQITHQPFKIKRIRVTKQSSISSLLEL